jgi:hypothetical protein
MLVLLMGMIYEVRRWDGLKWHDIYVPSFMKIDYRRSSNIKVLPQQFERYYWKEGFAIYGVEIGSDSMIHAQNSMTIESSI